MVLGNPGPGTTASVRNRNYRIYRNYRISRNNINHYSTVVPIEVFLKSQFDHFWSLPFYL
jgi:hypothetical protein